MAGLLDDFNSEYGSDDSSSQDDEVNRVIQDFTDEDIDEEMAEAAKKLAKASYYKAIARAGVIQDDGTPESIEINAESRLWARQQMVKLLSGRDPAVPPPIKVEMPFTDKQIEILQQVADKLLFQRGERSSEPVVNKVPNQQPSVPTVKKLQTKTPTKPVVKPLATKPGRRPNAQQPKKAAGVLKPRKNEKGELDYDNIPMEEVFRDTDGKLYRFVPHPSEDNQRVKIKVSGQVRGTGGFPTPSPAQMVQISQSQSIESVNSGHNANTVHPDTEGGPDVMVLAATGSLRKA